MRFRTFLIFFIIFQPVYLYCQPQLNYAVVKFDQSVSTAKSNDIIEEIFGNAILRVHTMHEHYRNSNYSINIIIELKENFNLSAVKQRLFSFPEVQGIGSAFQDHDVMHFTNGELAVKFKDFVTDSEIGNINKLFNCTIIDKLDLSPAEKNVYLLKVSKDRSDNLFETVSKYAFTPFVEYAQPNFIRSGMLLSPDDSLLPRMWHIKNTGNNIPDSIQGIPGCDANVDSAWNITTGNTQVLLAIIDTGVDTNHPDLRLNLCDRRFWYDAYEEDQTPEDEHSHGTGVSGVAEAIGNNHIGTAGVSFTCKLMPVRVFGPAPEAYTTDWIIAKGLNWAWTHGADIMSNSWGGGIPTPLISNAIINAVRFGRNGKGTVVFAAAGNSNIDTILYPSSMPEVIAVGGLSPCNQRKNPQSCDLSPWGACYGEGLSIVAPTVYIATTQANNPSNYWCICGNGTSVASPLAAGVGALILTKNINLSYDSVRIIIERSAVKVGNYSYNIPKRNGLWNNEMGYGRIDAKRALDMTPPGPSLIADQSPPIINFTPPESRPFSSAVVIDAVITDNQMVASGPNSPRLYFNISGGNYPQFVSGVQNKNNIFTFTVPALNYGARMYYYVAAQDTSSNRNITTYPFGGSGFNPPGTNSPPRRLFFQNTEYFVNSFYSSDVPKYITQVRETTVVSVLNNPVSKSILDLNCLINISHSSVIDLDVSLISPAGTEIILTGGLPTRGNGENYANTLFDDEASVSIADTNYHPPYTGIFKPLEKLWLLDGENSAGEWKLQIVDNAPGSGGVLNAWDIAVKYSTYEEIFPSSFALVKNYPNPFNPGTRIVFNVPYRANVKIKIYDILGREVQTVLNELRAPRFEDFIDFDTREFNGGRGLPSGVYFYSLFANDNFIESKKMVLVK